MDIAVVIGVQRDVFVLDEFLFLCEFFENILFDGGIEGSAVAFILERKGIGVLADLIHPHPSIIEGIQECVRMLMGKSIFKSSVFKDKLKCYRVVNGETIQMEKL